MFRFLSLCFCCFRHIKYCWIGCWFRCPGILFEFYIGNVLLLKPLRTFSLTSRRNVTFFIKYFFWLIFPLYLYLLYLLSSSSASSIDETPVCINSSLYRMKSLIGLCGNIFSIWFNFSILLERFKEFKSRDLFPCLFFKSLS